MIRPDSGRPDRAYDETEASVVALGADDVPEMLDLVVRSQPGPFWPRTPELGT
jgi:hypothetical protein